MAVTVTTVRSGVGKSVHIAEVTATADADAAATIPHGLGVVPTEVVLVGLKAAAIVSNWVTTTIDATNVILAKGTGTGSGVAGVQVRAIIRADNHLIH